MRSVAKFAGSLAVSLLFAAVAGYTAWGWLTGWSGLRDSRPVVGGDRIAMNTGQAVEVPEGWTGRYELYWRLPSWLPLGENHPEARHRVEVLQLRGKERGADVALIAESFVDAEAWGAARARSADDSEVSTIRLDLKSESGVVAVAQQSISESDVAVTVFVRKPARPPGMFGFRMWRADGKPVEVNDLVPLVQRVLGTS